MRTGEKETVKRVWSNNYRIPTSKDDDPPSGSGTSLTTPSPGSNDGIDSLLRIYAASELQKLTIVELRKIISEAGYGPGKIVEHDHTPAGKLKDDLISSILTGQQNKFGISGTADAVVRTAQSQKYAAPSPLGKTYVTHFNYVDKFDKKWYKYNDRHCIRNWRGKYGLSLLRCWVINFWAHMSTLQAECLKVFRANLALALIECNVER